MPALVRHCRQPTNDCLRLPQPSVTPAGTLMALALAFALPLAFGVGAAGFGGGAAFARFRFRQRSCCWTCSTPNASPLQVQGTTLTRPCSTLTAARDL